MTTHIQRPPTVTAHIDNPPPATHQPTTVYVTTHDGNRITYAHIPNGDPARIQRFLDAARNIPAYRNVSTDK